MNELSNLFSRHHELRATADKRSRDELQKVWQRLKEAMPPPATAASVPPEFTALLRRHGLRLAELAAARRADLSDLSRRMVSLVTQLRMTRASPALFNAFEVLKVRRREYVHSNVLAWLSIVFSDLSNRRR
jgi:hypothetical protein